MKKEFRSWKIQADDNGEPVSFTRVFGVDENPGESYEDYNFIKVVSQDDIQKIIGMGLTRYHKIFTDRLLIRDLLDRAFSVIKSYQISSEGLREDEYADLINDMIVKLNVIKNETDKIFNGE